MADYAYNESAVFKLTSAAGTRIHGATGQFLLSVDPSFPEATHYTLAEIMANCWISFARAHDPNTFPAPIAHSGHLIRAAVPVPLRMKSPLDSLFFESRLLASRLGQILPPAQGPISLDRERSKFGIDAALLAEGPNAIL